MFPFLKKTSNKDLNVMSLLDAIESSSPLWIKSHISKYWSLFNPYPVKPKMREFKIHVPSLLCSTSPIET